MNLCAFFEFAHLENHIQKLLVCDKKNASFKDGIYRIFNNSVDNSFVSGFIDNIHELVGYNMTQIARVSFIKLISRYYTNQYSDVKLSDENVLKTKALASEMNLDIDDYLEAACKFSLSKHDYYSVDDLQSNIEITLDFVNLEFHEIIHYYENNSLLEIDLPGLMECIKSMSHENIVMLIQCLTCGKRYIKDRTRHFENVKKLARECEIISDQKAIFFTYLFCYEENGWYTKFVNAENFMYACSHNYDLALKTLCKLLFNVLRSGLDDCNISSNLIIAFNEVSKDKKVIIDMWDKLYEIIEYRLPNSIEYDWTTTINNEFNMNESELYICLLLCRSKNRATHIQKNLVNQLSYYINL